MKKILIATALCLPLLASAQNLLVNGSFEQGLAGWTVVNGAGTAVPVNTVTYHSLPGAYQEIVPADNLAGSLSPDSVGTRAVYFVDDKAFQSISQNFVVASAGNYNLGLSYYVPANGAANPADVNFSLAYGSTSESRLIGTLPVKTWLGSNSVQTLAPGNYSFTISFAPSANGFGKDVLVDRVYVTAVPEPSTIALLLAGLGLVSLQAARRRG